MRLTRSRRALAVLFTAMLAALAPLVTADDAAPPPKPAATTPPAAPPPATGDAPPPKPTDTTPAERKYSDLVAIIDTDAGVIKVKLAPNEVPRLVAHFVNLTNRHFYDGLTFHSAARNRQIHSGDPTGTGKGDCGYTVPKSFHKDLMYGSAGVMGLWSINGDPSSQFFITLFPNDRKYNLNIPAIGNVVEGLDIAETIKQGDIVKTIRIEGDSSKLLGDLATDVVRWNEVLEREAAKKKTEAGPQGTDPSLLPPPREKVPRSGG